MEFLFDLFVYCCGFIQGMQSKHRGSRRSRSTSPEVVQAKEHVAEVIQAKEYVAEVVQAKEISLKE